LSCVATLARDIMTGRPIGAYGGEMGCATRTFVSVHFGLEEHECNEVICPFDYTAALFK